LDSNKVWSLIEKHLADPKVLLDFNHGFEGRILRKKGIVRKTNVSNTRDVMIFLWLWDSNRKRLNLKDAAEDLLKMDMITLKEVPGCEEVKNKVKSINFGRTRPREATLYAAADPVATFRIYDKTKDEVFKEQKFILQIEHALLDVLADMEMNSVYIDRAFLKRGIKDLLRWQSQLTDQIYKSAGYDFNIGSTAEVGKYLKAKGVKLPKTGTGRDATGADVLEKMSSEYPEIAMVLSWRSLDKERGTYAQKLLDSTTEEAPYCSFKFKSVGAPTGRFARS